MTEVEELIGKGESETIEFKEKFDNEAIETAVAFANTNGGIILIGVFDKGGIKGVEVGRDTIEKITNKILQATDPKMYPKISIREVNDNRIIVIGAEESNLKPCFAFGRAFKRVGKSTVKMGKDEIEKLILERKKIYWDEQICEGAKLEDIDKEKVRWFLRKTKYERNFDVSVETPVEEALERLELIKNGKLTNAAILLFGKNPQKFFLQAETRCARFKGTKPLEFIDMKVFPGDIIDQRDDAIEFVKEHIKLHAEIKGTERVERWEYPIEAVRESITNAICHRDYRIASNVQVRIFDDRIEIWGVGPLLEPLTIEDLKRKHASILRNLLIGKCFFLIKFIEEWGTGTNRIIEWCLKYGLPEPIFEEISGSLVVTIRKYHISDEILEKLSERQKKILEYLKRQGRITRKECMKLLNTSKDTAFRDLMVLHEKGIVERRGKGKNVEYFFK